MTDDWEHFDQITDERFGGVAIVVVTDGRHEYLQPTVRSIEEMIHGPIVERWMHDDSGDDDYRRRLSAEFPTYTQLGSGPRRGFGGAVGHIWQTLASHSSTADYVFWAEDDFTYNEPVDIDRMIGVLERHPDLVQLSLKRQPVNNEEKAVGDFIALHPDDYHEITENGDTWLQQRRFFSTNPSLYRMSLCERGWPQEQHSEGKFTGYYFRDHPDHWSGIWGAKWDKPRVYHIGDHRSGTGY